MLLLLLLLLLLLMLMLLLLLLLPRANIQHRKKAQDNKRNKYFNKMSKAIMAAAKEGEESVNPRLRSLILEAKRSGVPKDNIQKAVDKGLNAVNGQGDQFEEVVYEGYGPGGIAVMVETLTDNRNRTPAELRHIFDKNGGNMSGSVSWIFTRKARIEPPEEYLVAAVLLPRHAIILDVFLLFTTALKLSASAAHKVPLLTTEYDGDDNANKPEAKDEDDSVEMEGKALSEDEIMEISLSLGAEDIEAHEDIRIAEVFCAPADVKEVQNGLEEAVGASLGFQFVAIPNSKILLASEDEIEQFTRFLEAVDDQDDVQTIHHNAELGE
eukprot:jgi/Bigna1/73313/fgenesh1_pg.23_\